MTTSVIPLIFFQIVYIYTKERMVVVRETDGLLRKAGWDERDRVMQIYYPSPYRTMSKPRWVHDMSVIFNFSFFVGINLGVYLMFKLHFKIIFCIL